MDTEKASNFINSLVRNLQVLCHSNVDFSEDVEVIGHIYLSVDKSKKFNYIVNEKVCKNDNSSTVFVSNSFHADQQKKKDNDSKNSKNANKLQLEQSNENEIKQQRMLGFHGNRDSQFHHPSPSKRHLSHSENSSGNQKLRRKSSASQDKRHAESVSTASGMSIKMEQPASSLGDTFSPNKSHQPAFSSPAASPVKGLSSSDPVDVDLTSVKDEPDDENSSLFSQNTAWNQQPDPTYDIPRAGPSDDMFGMYPPVHQLSQQEAQSNLEVLAQMSGQNPSGSGDSPDNQMPLVPSAVNFVNSKRYRRKFMFSELTQNEKHDILSAWKKSPKPTVDELASKFNIEASVINKVLDSDKSRKLNLRIRPFSKKVPVTKIAKKKTNEVDLVTLWLPM